MPLTKTLFYLGIIPSKLDPVNETVDDVTEPDPKIELGRKRKKETAKKNRKEGRTNNRKKIRRKFSSKDWSSVEKYMQLGVPRVCLKRHTLGSIENT